MDAMAGAGSDEGETVKGIAFERTPELDTSIFTVPAEAISAAGTTAVSCVELTKVVARADGSAGGGLLTHSTTEPFTKFEPFTVRVKPEGVHDGVELDEVVDDDKELMEGETIVNGADVGEVPPPGPMVNTTT